MGLRLCRGASCHTFEDECAHPRRALCRARVPDPLLPRGPHGFQMGEACTQDSGQGVKAEEGQERFVMAGKVETAAWVRGCCTQVWEALVPTFGVPTCPVDAARRPFLFAEDSDPAGALRDCRGAEQERPPGPTPLGPTRALEPPLGTRREGSRHGAEEQRRSPKSYLGVRDAGLWGSVLSQPRGTLSEALQVEGTSQERCQKNLPQGTGCPCWFWVAPADPRAWRSTLPLSWSYLELTTAAGAEAANPGREPPSSPLRPWPQGASLWSRERGGLGTTEVLQGGTWRKGR